jgi:hypothetical protein
MKYHDYTDERFADAKALQDFYRQGNTLKYDYLIVGGILYTMHEYDHDGRYVTYANKKHKMMIEVTTSNRYGDTGYTDATVDVYPADYIRDDITYAE